MLSVSATIENFKNKKISITQLDIPYDAIPKTVIDKLRIFNKMTIEMRNYDQVLTFASNE